MAARPPVQGAKNVRVSTSGVHGRGLFAARQITKGQRVVEYVGHKVTKAESERRTQRQWTRGRVYTFELNARYDIDGSPLWNKARWANHSCDPNTETEIIRGRIWLVALRDIAVGEEVTYDYNFPVDDEPAPCRCGSRRCRGFIVGSQHARKLRRWLDTNGTRPARVEG